VIGGTGDQRIEVQFLNFRFPISKPTRAGGIVR
jgi:hypothetical protein